MIDAVFISDLHLHPKEHDIQERFNQFIEWAKISVKNIYILGDFFHVWAGDDSIDDWSRGIAHQLSILRERGVNLYYMHGNRDFLLGNTFARLAGWAVLTEPTIIQLNQEKILLVHGDRYCTKDSAHQRFRKLTRNKLFSILFLKIPLIFRERLVRQIRNRSKINQNKTAEEMDVVAESVMKHMRQYNVTQLIHGHTHKPGLIIHHDNHQKLKRYVLSDWDDKPWLLCYDNTKSFYFDYM